MTWEALWTAYLQHLDGANFGAATRMAVGMWVPRFIALCQRRQAEPAQAASEHVRAYELELLWQPGPRGRLYAANTVDQALRTVPTFLRWAHGQGLLPRHPSGHLVLGRPVQQPTSRVLTPEEVERLLGQPELTSRLGLRDRCILELVYVTGMSSQELCGLDLADLSLAERLVLARQGGGLPARPLRTHDPAPGAAGAVMLEVSPRTGPRPGPGGAVRGQARRPALRAPGP